ncbi:hypothetical protein OPV22_033360 [Ensete ventricosum]|uniref:AN1-type domain-containing protein n=1 Tax=Ensete ventricosum TaxID=4639 RepID=A0AAV8PMI3_ENSVE|nr:hypothetical protein OPV22_033360 [Ensete ventricosum]
MEHNKTKCQAPEGPILCINNCGFFGSAATMNMCSKCHKDMMLKQEQAKLDASSNGNLASGKGPVIITGSIETREAKAEGPNRCNTCRKRVGLTGFRCRCGDLFCSVHRYSDKHDCPFDYQTSAREAIAKANPVVKAEKLKKI